MCCGNTVDSVDVRESAEVTPAQQLWLVVTMSRCWGVDDFTVARSVLDGPMTQTGKSSHYWPSLTVESASSHEVAIDHPIWPHACVFGRKSHKSPIRELVGSIGKRPEPEAISIMWLHMRFLDLSLLRFKMEFLLSGTNRIHSFVPIGQKIIG